MPNAYKPQGYPSVSAYLIAHGADAVIEFLKRTFDATLVRRFEPPDGRLMHAEIRIDDSLVMLGGAATEWQPVPAHLHVYVEDVDATVRRALEAGGVAVQQPEQKGDGDRRGGVKDPAGNTWWIATATDAS